MTDRKRTAVDWEDVRVFLALARDGSLSAAARSLGVNHATIARRLHALEASLGEALVERRPTGYVLTAAGMRTLEAASGMDAEAQKLGRAVGDGAPAGLVRINAPPGLAAGFLTERLAAMAARHAGLDIDLATRLRSVSLERHEADIAIRVGRPEDGDVIARLLGRMGFGFYGVDALCRSIEQGAEPVFVGFDEADAYLPEAMWLSRRFPRARLAFRAGDQFAQAVAARTGVGIALLPHYIGRIEPLLRPVDLGAVPPPREIHILTRRRDRGHRAIEIVTAEIRDIFRKSQALFE
ncbi:LysR family transcriptional regulator [Sphingobium ummariense]